MDPLSHVLDLSRVSVALMVSVRACAPWGLDLPQRPGASFHAITSGTAWLRVGDSEPLQLMPGDVFLLPAGARHRLSSEPEGRCVPFDSSLHERPMTPDGEAPSWLRALRDPALARVLAALHERPAEPWTVESLAREVHVSRATLARRFAEVVGEPPLTYLARWRMHLAAQRLKYSTDTVEAIAREVGYTSAYAFNRAFARHRGQPPGRYRRLASAA